MRIRIKRLSSYYCLVLVAVAVLFPLSGTALARSPRPATSTIYGELLYADPGEDPHLKVEPLVSPISMWEMDEGISLSTTRSVDPVILGGRQETGCNAGTGRSRVKTKLLVTLQILFGQLFR